jgi:uncharacterized protein related to proFAR isomerase
MAKAFRGFLEIPAVSILKGTIVIVNSGKYETLTIDKKIPDALDMLEILTENYPTIYISDISGLIDGKPQLEFLKRLTDFCEVWVDSGVVEAENVYDLFVAGASEVILSSKMINGLSEVAHAYELSENLIFQIDFDNGIISQNKNLRSMNPEDLIKELRDIGITRIIFADLSRIGSRKRLDYNLIRYLNRVARELFVGGGVKLNDVQTLRNLGCSGAVLELIDVLKRGKVDF